MPDTEVSVKKIFFYLSFTGNATHLILSMLKTKKLRSLCLGKFNTIQLKTTSIIKYFLIRKYTDMSAWVYQSPEETGTGYYEGKVRKWKVKYYIVVF